MEERRKIYIDNKLSSGLFQGISLPINLDITQEVDDAELVIWKWDIERPGSYKNFEAQIKELSLRKKRTFLFLYELSQPMSPAEVLEHPEIGGLLLWIDEQKIDIGFDSVSGFKKDGLDEWVRLTAQEEKQAGSPNKSAASSPRAVPYEVSAGSSGAAAAAHAAAVPAPAVAAPKAAFFNYPFPAKTLCHSRQLRREYSERKLRLNENGMSEKELKKRLILFFAHYMSIRHVNSAFSKAMEDALIKHFNLNEVEDPVLQNRNKWWKRAFIRGKKYDRVALKLRALMLQTFLGGDNPETVCKLNFLIDILRSVDSLEKDYFQYNAKKEKIENTLYLAERVQMSIFSGENEDYNHEWEKDMVKKREARAYKTKDRGRDIALALQAPPDKKLNLPGRAERCVKRWVARKGLSY